MKKNVLLSVLLLLFAAITFAQAPQLLNYQAVVRNAGGQPVTTGTVKLRFTIHDGTAGGATVFQEVQSATPNQFGLVTASIGSVNNNLATVNWGGGAKHLQVEIDITGGTNYTDMGTTQLLSVPYALYAANSAPGPQGPQGVTGPQGVQGTVGAAGAQGPTGATGNAGVQGPQGLPGNTGAVGAIGNTGPQGLQGVPGVAGPIGDTGPQGLQGAQGVQGVAGPVGDTGPQGTQGIQGPQGNVGPAGPTGDVGPTGAQGIQGVQGIQGIQGVPGSNASLPQGMIVMWSGALANVPAGWQLCDGTNGTPNLFDRFVLSIPNNGTNPGAIGGSHAYTLTEAQLPPHSHTGGGTTSVDGQHTHTMPGYHLYAGTQIPWYNWANNQKADNTNTTSADGAHAHTFNFTTNNTGGGAGIDNRPAYYTLAFIMKM